MKQNIHVDGSDLYLSKKYLKSFASVKTIEWWNEEMGVVIIKIENEPFYSNKTMPGSKCTNWIAKCHRVCNKERDFQK
ncbi:hypothetical protein BH09BAC2_BH09BAC2_00480 [soil metagenome]